MKKIYNLLCLKLIIFVSVTVLLESCHKKSILDTETKSTLYNSFTMELNGEETWLPGQIGEDECMRTYYGTRSSLGGALFYNIYAYRDPNGFGDVNSENVFKLQIMNVRELGTYEIIGSYKESFESYAVFIVNKPDGTSVRYVNKPYEVSFRVAVNEFFPLPNSYNQGFKGSFSGTLYNEANNLDSITIAKGDFMLRKVNWHNFNQCEE